MLGPGVGPKLVARSLPLLSRKFILKFLDTTWLGPRTRRAAMDAQEFFQNIVQRSYYEYCQNPNDIRLLWNAIVSMNTVPDHIALDRLGYVLEVNREEFDAEVQEVRKELDLTELQYCANTLKHVRRIPRGQFTATASSTSVDPIDQDTWVLDGHDLVQVAHDSFNKLKTIFQSSGLRRRANP